MESYQQAVGRARQKGACTSALAELKQLRDWDEFFSHPSAPEWAYWYAHNVLRERWPEAEPVIVQSRYWACKYAMDVIKGRWPEAEPIMIKDPYWGYKYAMDIIKGRWPEAEPVIIQHPYWAYFYARNVIQGRWPEAEPVIRQDKLDWREYQKFVESQR
jgi:hypothetical protein